MKLTAELALSQVKRNKKRTAGTVFATALSTALVTAVMCFVTSGIKMLKDFLGDSYGEYGAAYISILLIPAIILGFLIAFMSVTVISNIYESSANKRLSEFGVLKCVGATKKQIRQTVIYESIWISLIAVPIGLALGTFIGFIGVLTAGKYISDFNELSKSIIMRPFSFALTFHISIWTYVFAAIFSMIIVRISAGKPARNSGKITAIECIKGISGKAIKNVAVKEKRSIEKLFGYEGILGYKNLKRNKTGYKSSVRALALSIMLILMTGSFAKQASGIVSWMGAIGNDMLVDYASSAYYEMRDTGKEETIIRKPINFETAEEITQKLRAYNGGMEVLGVGSDTVTYNAVMDEAVLTDELKSVKDIVDENGEMDVEILAFDRATYENICNEAGLAVGSNILINSYGYNENGSIKNIVPFSDDVKKITLINARNEEKEVEIQGQISMDSLPENIFPSITQEPVWILVPDGEFRFFDWYSNPEDDISYTEFARNVMDEYYPLLTEDSYVDQGYTVRISRADQMAKVMNIAIILGEILLMGLIIMLISMGFASVISTLSTNIRLRKKEFAVLKSVGMTGKSLEKMLYSESIICIIKSVLWGAGFGILLPWLINLSLRQVFPVRYELPIMALVIGLVIVSGMLILITKIEINGFRKQNIIEDIRMDTM